MNVILYLRVSTDEQAEKGHSIKQQEESLISYCKRMQYDILKIYKEDHSAKNFNRPEWANLKAFVKANKNQVTKVLFTKWDRFSRSTELAYAVLSDFRKMGIELNAVEQPLDFTQTNYKIMLAVYLAQGEMERDNISDRTLKGTHQAKKDGYYCGKAPYGYDNARDEFKKSIIKPNKNADLVRMAFEEVAKGIEPVEEIRKRLFKLGMNLQKSAFSDLLKNPIYTGKITVPEYQKEAATTVNGKHEAIIDIVTFNKVQAVFRGKRWHGLKPSHRNETFPLRDFLSCEVCGRQITGSMSQGRSKKYAYYHCRQKCETRVLAEVAHSNISNVLKGLQINKNVKELFADILKDTEVKSKGDRELSLTAMLDKQKLLKKRIEDAEDMLFNKDIGVDRVNSMVSRYTNELMALNTEIEVLSNNSESIKGFVESGLELLTNLDRLFIESDYEGKRILVGSLFNDKLVFGNNGCRTTKVNGVVELLTRTGGPSENFKKGKAPNFESFSAKVPGAGVEPACPKTQVFETSASTNSAIRATLGVQK